MFLFLILLSILIKKNFLMKKFNKNNLSEDLSPYLFQHKDNPVNWQTGIIKL